MDKYTGQRQDVPHRVLFPLLEDGSTKLSVATETKVCRILLDGQKRATGVEYIHNSETACHSPQVIRARRMVLLASGALGSPQILERSGIGGESLLSSLNIPVKSDLPGIGDYQDHNGIFFPYRSTAATDESLDGLLSGRLSLDEAIKLKESNPEKNILGWNGLECFGKIRPSAKEISNFHPCLKAAWEADFRDCPEKPLMMISTIAGYTGDQSSVDPRQYFSCGPFTPYPYSRGSIHITGQSAFDPYDFDCGFLSHRADLEKLVWGYKVQREIARRMRHYDGPLLEGHPTFPPGSKADYKTVDEESAAKGYPVPIIYTEDDEESIRYFISQNMHTTWHSLGTCAMKPREDGGVVDNDLNVYGVDQLKVVGESNLIITRSSNY